MEPFTTAALATALTTLVNGAAGEAGKTAWKSLTGFIQARFGGETAPATALAALEQAPADQQNADRVAVLLHDLAATDATAATWLNPWFDQVREAAGVTAPVSNVISGQAQVHGPVVQGHTFNGSINF